jgi:hypothetical protein
MPATLHAALAQIPDAKTASVAPSLASMAPVQLQQRLLQCSNYLCSPLLTQGLPGFLPLLHSRVPDNVGFPRNFAPLATGALWEVAIGSIVTHMRTLSTEGVSPTVMLSGARNHGKSSLSRSLVHRLLDSFRAVAFLETDTGQSEFTPAGLVSLTIITRPAIGPPASHIVASLGTTFLTGASSPAQDPIVYLSAVRAALEAGRAACGGAADVPLVVNTPGWTTGLGKTALAHIVALAQPHFVVELNDKLHAEAVEGAARHLGGSAKHQPDPSSLSFEAAVIAAGVPASRLARPPSPAPSSTALAPAVASAALDLTFPDLSWLFDDVHFAQPARLAAEDTLADRTGTMSAWDYPEASEVLSDVEDIELEEDEEIVERNDDDHAASPEATMPTTCPSSNDPLVSILPKWSSDFHSAPHFTPLPHIPSEVAPVALHGIPVTAVSCALALEQPPKDSSAVVDTETLLQLVPLAGHGSFAVGTQWVRPIACERTIMDIPESTEAYMRLLRSCAAQPKLIRLPPLPPLPVISMASSASPPAPDTRNIALFAYLTGAIRTAQPFSTSAPSAPLGFPLYGSPRALSYFTVADTLAAMPPFAVPFERLRSLPARTLYEGTFRHERAQWDVAAPQQPDRTLMSLSEPLTDGFLASVNGAVVALCSSTFFSTQCPNLDPAVVATLPPPCLALALVRATDLRAQMLYLLAPISDDLTALVDLIVPCSSTAVLPVLAHHVQHFPAVPPYTTALVGKFKGVGGAQMKSRNNIVRSTTGT